MTYDIGVLNTGNSTALNVAIADVLPPGTSFVSVTGTGPFHDACSFSPASNTLTCLADVVPTGLHHITLVAKTPERWRGTLTNTATVTAAVGSIVGGSASASTQVILHSHHSQ